MGHHGCDDSEIGNYNSQNERIGMIRSEFSLILFLPLLRVRGTVNHECTKRAGPRGEAFDSELSHWIRMKRFKQPPFWCAAESAIPNVISSWEVELLPGHADNFR